MAMSTELYQQLLTTTTSLLLLTAVLQVWGRSVRRSIALLAIQGAALAGLALLVGLQAGEAEAPFVAALVLVVKSIAMPWAMIRTAGLIGVTARAPMPALATCRGVCAPSWWPTACRFCWRTAAAAW